MHFDGRRRRWFFQPVNNIERRHRLTLPFEVAAEVECLIVIAEKKDVVNGEVFLWLFWVARPHPDCRRRRSSRGLTRRRVEFLKGLLLALYWRANGSHEMFREPQSFSTLRRTTGKGKRSREKKKGLGPLEGGGAS